MNSTGGTPFGSSPFGTGSEPAANAQHSAGTQQHRPRPSSTLVTLAWMLGAFLLVVVLGLGSALVVDANRDASEATETSEADTSVNALAAGPALG